MKGMEFYVQVCKDMNESESSIKKNMSNLFNVQNYMLRLVGKTKKGIW